MSRFCADKSHLIVIDGIRYATKEDVVFYGANASTKYDIEVAYKGLTKHFRYDDKVVRDEMFNSIVAEMSNLARPTFSALEEKLKLKEQIIAGCVADELELEDILIAAGFKEADSHGDYKGLHVLVGELVEKLKKQA